MRTPQDTALLIVGIFHRSGERRARVSQLTLRLLGGRKHLRSAFIVAVCEILAMDFDLIMVELASGAFGIMQTKPLEGAKPITAKRWLSEEELHSVKRGVPNFRMFRKEIAAHESDAADDPAGVA